MVTVLFFSTFEVVSRTLKGQVNPLQLNFLRFFGGGLFLLPFALRDLRYRGVRLRLADVGALLFVGALNVGVSMTLLQFGIDLSSASIAAVVFSSNPLAVCLAAALVLGETLTWQKLCGVSLGFLGLVIASSRSGGGASYYLGVLLAFSSAVVFGFYTVVAKRFALRYGSLAMNSLSFVFGSLLLLPLLKLLALPAFAVSPTAWLRIAYLSICVTGIAYFTYFSGLSLCDTSLGSMVFFVKPVLASLLAAAVLGEALTWRLGAGILLVLLGIHIIQQAVKPRAAEGRLNKSLY